MAAGRQEVCLPVSALTSTNRRRRALSRGSDRRGRPEGPHDRRPRGLAIAFVVAVEAPTSAFCDGALVKAA